MVIHGIKDPVVPPETSTLRGARHTQIRLPKYIPRILQHVANIYLWMRNN